MSSVSAFSAHYEGKFYRFYTQNRSLTTLATGAMLLGGLVLLGISSASFALHGVSKDAIGMMTGGSVATGLSLWAIKEIKKGKKGTSWKPLGPYRTCHATAKGDEYHPINQDRSICEHTGEGVLFGVFDGHGTGGENVASLCQEKVSSYFRESYAQNKDAKAAITSAVARLQTETQGLPGGAVMALCYIDDKTKKRTTALLGDCDIRFYRKQVDGHVQSTTLTKPTDWSHSKESVKVKGNSRYQIQMQNNNKPRLYDFHVGLGLNFTGSIGDHRHPILNRVPTFQEDTAQQGDLVIASTDGISDYGPQLDHLVQEKWGTSKNLAREAVWKVFCEWHSFHIDDRTAVCLFIPA